MKRRDDSVLPAEASATPVTIVGDGEPADDIPEEEGVFEQDSFVDDSEEVRPPSLDTPRGGKPDDLKKIGGIGPEIEGILHELGIFTSIRLRIGPRVRRNGLIIT